MTLEERLHVLRRDQTHIVADRCKLPTDVMGARAGLHADQAARNVGETAFELTTGYFLLQDDYTPLVEANEVERVLAEVDPDRGDGSTCLLRCAHRMRLERLLRASQPQSSGLGAERGRAIPLADVIRRAIFLMTDVSHSRVRSRLRAEGARLILISRRLACYGAGGERSRRNR